MLWEMRGCDGNLGGWNASHGSGDSTRGVCTMKKFEVGAYVVNSNNSWAGSCNGYYQADNSQDYAIRPSYNCYKSKRPSIPDDWQKSMDSRESLSYYPTNQGNTSNTQSVLHEKRPSNLVNSVNYRTRQNSSDFSVQPSKIETFRNSVPALELGSNRLVDGSRSGNIYQGTMVRVKVPELYSEVGESSANMKENGANVVYGHEVSTAKQYLQETQNFNNHQVYGGSVPMETHRRINDWLRNCQQFSGDTFKSSQSSKSALGSQRVNHAHTEKINQQHVVSASRQGYGVSVQSGAVSNSRISDVPRIVAGLESKNTKTRAQANSSGQYQRSTSVVWTERNELSYLHGKQGSRNLEVESSRVSNVNCAAQRHKTYFECDLSLASSEWSSETLSIAGSDKSSYCTDFTPFELGKKNIVLRTQGRKSASEFAQEHSPTKRKNIFVSQISIEGKPHARNGAQEKVFSQISKKQSPNAHLSEKSNAKFGNHARHGHFESKYRQCERLNRNPEEDEARKLKIIQINLPARKSQTPVADVLVGEDRSSHLKFSGYDETDSCAMETESQTRHRKCQPMIHPQDTRTCGQNFENFEGGSGHKNDRANISGNIVKLNKEESNRPSGPDVQLPRSSTIFAEKIRPLSLVQDEILSGQGNEVNGKSNSRPVARLKNGSLSITIQPKYPTAFEIFNNLVDAKDSVRPEDEISLLGIRKQSSEDAILEAVINKPSENLGPFESTEIFPVDKDSVSECSNASRQDSENLDMFTRTVIEVDALAKVTPPASKAERPFKLEYKCNRYVKADTSQLRTDVPSRFEQIVSEKQRIQVVSDFDEHASCNDNEHTSCNDNESREFQQSSCEDEKQINISSRSSTVLSSHSSSKVQNVKKISALKRIFKKAKSYMGEKLGDGSIDRDYKRKNNSVGSLEVENRTGPQNRLSELFLSLTTSRSKSRCKHLEVFDEIQTSLPDNSVEMHAAPNASSWYENQDQVDDMSQVCGYETSYLHLDPLRSDDDVLETRSGNETTSSVDTLLVRLQASQPQDLPSFNEFRKPQFQTLVHTLQQDVEPTFGEDLADQSLRRLADYSERNFGSNSASKQSRVFEMSELSDAEVTKYQETRSVNDLEITSANESQVLNSSVEFTQDCRGLEGNEYSDNLFMSDSVSLVSEVLKAFDVIQRKGKELLDSETEDLCSEPRDDTDSARHKSNDINEQMSCQEVVELHEELFIEPPMSFSDFTIVL